MTWLYIPSTSSQFAQASEASSSDSNSLTLIGERLSEASATWRGKQLPPQAWSRQWKRGGFIRRLSGLTLDPSTAQAGVDSWISSLRAIRAKETASPESGSANSTIGGCSTAPSTFSTRRGLILSSARTCRGTRTDSSPLPFRHWSDWAAALRSEYSARPKLAIPCAGSDCSSWPSAKVASGGWERDRNGNVYPTLEGAAQDWRSPSDVSKRGGSQHPEKRAAGGHTINLEDQAEHWAKPQMWPTASVLDTADSTDPQKLAERRARHKARGINGNGFGVSLGEMAMNWAGPAAQNHKGSSQGSITRQDGKSRADILSYQAEQFFHPPSSQAQPTTLAGALCSTDTPNTNQPSVKRKLNPIFVEALMRWPTGLSGFERPATASIPSPPPSHLSAYRSCSHDQHLYPDANEGLPALQQDDDPAASLSNGSLGEAQMVRQNMHGCGEEASGAGLRQVRSGIPSEGEPEARPSVLLDPVCQHRQTDQGAIQEDAGPREGPGRASCGEGARGRQAARALGGCSPQGSPEAEQRPGEPWLDDQCRSLADAHEGEQQCSPFMMWQRQQLGFLSAIFSQPEAAQQELF